MLQPRLLLSCFTTLSVAAVALLAFGPSAQASVKDPTTASVLKAAKAAMLKESGVHIVVDSRSGKTTSAIIVDIGTSSGVETITSGKESVTIEVTPKWAYLSGSASGLTTVMGLTSAEQKKVGSSSVSMKAGTTPYKNLKENLTVSILPTLLPVAKGTSFSVGGGSNSKDYQLTWSTAATSSEPKTKSVLTISSGSKTLPLDEVISSSTGGGTTVFSKWGENVSVKKPASLVTYTKVFG